MADSGALEEDPNSIHYWLLDIIDSVRKVTHIAPPDDKGKIIGKIVQQEGVVFFPDKDYDVCTTVTDARFTVTTEVYPDSDKTTAEQCNDAQVASVVGALDFLVKNRIK